MSPRISRSSACCSRETSWYGRFPTPSTPIRAPGTAIVPGHGPVFQDYAYVRQVRELFERVLAQADTLVRQGKLRPDLEKAIDLSDVKPRFVKPGDATAEAYWQAAIKNSLVERTYQCLVGSRC